MLKNALHVDNSMLVVSECALRFSTQALLLDLYCSEPRLPAPLAAFLKRSCFQRVAHSETWRPDSCGQVDKAATGLFLVGL